MDWEIVIGLETHAQLSTASKIFSGASTRFGAEPNTQACHIDLALPGVLPLMNRQAVKYAIRFGLAVGATIAPRSIFARKNYFYPDLPKSYQISQYEHPVVIGGTITIPAIAPASGTEQSAKDSMPTTIHLTRAHLEEDAGKSLHSNFPGLTGIDLNRAGTPLLEIVTEPDMRSAAQAVAYAKTLHALVMWLGICDGNMQEGSFRCDANISVRRKGQEKLGTRVEIKNLNSFRFLEEAIEYEAQRQIRVIEAGGQVQQETRLYDPSRHETQVMRSKEDAHDYRYFPDPDLLPLSIDAAWIEEERNALPELPDSVRARFIQAYGLSDADAALLTSSAGLSKYYQAVVTQLGAEHAQVVARWVMGEVSAQLNRHAQSIESGAVSPMQLAKLIAYQLEGRISNKTAKEVLQQMWEAASLHLENPAHPSHADDAAGQLITEQNLAQVTSGADFEAQIEAVLAANPKLIEEFCAGKDKAFNALVGQLMKATQGKANPQEANRLLKEKLTSYKESKGSH